MNKVSEANITREEMIELFGEEMPLEAVNLLWNSPSDKTLSEIRAELRSIAALQASQESGEPQGEAGALAWSALEDALRFIDKAVGEGIQLGDLQAHDIWDRLTCCAGMPNPDNEDQFAATVLKHFRAQPAVGAEPVAWMWEKDGYAMGWLEQVTPWKPEESPTIRNVRPLYLSPTGAAAEMRERCAQVVHQAGQEGLAVEIRNLPLTDGGEIEALRAELYNCQHLLEANVRTKTRDDHAEQKRIMSIRAALKGGDA